MEKSQLAVAILFLELLHAAKFARHSSQLILYLDGFDVIWSMPRHKWIPTNSFSLEHWVQQKYYVVIGPYNSNVIVIAIILQNEFIQKHGRSSSWVIRSGAYDLELSETFYLDNKSFGTSFRPLRFSASPFTSILVSYNEKFRLSTCGYTVR